MSQEYLKGYEDGRDTAIKILCQMIDYILAGNRVELDKMKPHSETFERLIRHLDNKLH